MILLIDNYDSFTHNLARYIKKTTNQELKIIKNDALSLNEIIELTPSVLVISPGPGNPDNSGLSLDCLTYFKTKIPILGICLGHQCIASHFGATIDKAQKILHGKTSQVHFTADPIFNNISNPFEATRYHSLAIKENTLPSCLKVIARSQDDIMAIKHKTLPIYGFQFHPEAYLTQYGQQLINNFLNIEIK